MGRPGLENQYVERRWVRFPYTPPEVWYTIRMSVKVWIDQDLCTGDGLCAEICPDIFEMHDDGLAYVKEADWPDILNGTTEPAYQMATGLADVPDRLLEAVIESAEDCPGECIFIQVDE